MLPSLLLACVQSAQVVAPGGYGGLGRLAELRAAPDDGCVDAETRAWIAAQRREFARVHGPLSTPGPNGPGAPYPFYPLGATHNEDVLISGFADLDPAPIAFHDFECGPNTYDGHDASDTPIRSFEEQWIGVPVLAALDGTVIFARDGHPDMNLNGSVDPGNFVIVDHGNGREAQYFHLKNGSVAVNAGQTVRAGQVLGFAASSGNSFYPHLHFATYDNGTMVEPFAGACRSGASGWAAQPPILHDFRFLDGSPTWQDLFALNQPLPWPQPREGDFALTDGFVYFWFLAQALPPNSTWRHLFERPDGTIAFDSGDLAMGNADEYRWFNGFWYFWVNDMHAVPGTWHWRHVVNGVERTRAPIEVVTSRTPGFNRPPLPVALAFDPPTPSAGAATFCRVQGDHLVDDPDYDVLRYRYQWRVNGQVVRDATHAGRADALPAGAAGAGDSVQCTTTVSDGSAETLPVAIAAVVGGAPLALAAPQPGVAGTSNAFHASGAPPGGEVFFLYSLSLGSTAVPGCPGAALRILQPGVLGSRTADGAGAAALTLIVPGIAAGRTVHFQAVHLSGCGLANLMSWSFP